MPDYPTAEKRLQWLSLIQRYFEQDLNEQELRDYNSLLRESEAFRQLFVDYSRQCSAMLEVLEVHSGCTPYLDHAADPDLTFQAAAELLARGSENAQLVHLLGELKPHQRLKPYLIAAGIAAVLVLAITLTFVFSGGSNTPTQGPALTNDFSTPDRHGPAHAAVATLTDTTAAQWAEGALAPGSDLQANQRLTLTRGSATLTTAKGAIATIYAPCSIQFIDDNALHLTRGRLSGRVDTQQAEGFAVHLPTGDRIVDLGTAFTVAVADTGEADVRVTEGLVAWVPKSDDDTAEPKPTLIAAGESAQLVAGRPVLTRADRLLGIDFQHTGASTTETPQPMVGVTQPGFVAFDQTRIADGNRATFTTDAGEITLTLAGLDRASHNGYFTRLPTPAEDPFPGFDLYNDFVYENIDGKFTLTLAGPGITPGQAYELTFYAYDPGDGTAAGSYHGQTQSVAFTGIDGTTGQAGPITYTVGTHPTRIEQLKTTATFTADAQGQLTIEATDAFENNEQHIRLGAIEIARPILAQGASEAGITSLSGDIRWSPRAAYLDRSQWRADGDAVVFEELPRYRLGADTPVTLLGPGTNTDLDKSSPAQVLQAGTTVRTDIVLLYNNIPGHTPTPQGSVTFEGEVLGIATHDVEARALADQVGDPARLAPIATDSPYWLEPSDLASLQDDRRTVRFAFSCKQGTDAIRVFVRDPAGEQP